MATMVTRQQSRELQNKWDDFEDEDPDEDEDEMVTVEHCTTPLQVFCTVCFVIIFASGVIAASMFTYSSSRVISAATNYPEFIGEVLEEAVDYQVVDDAAAEIVTVAKKGLAKCGVKSLLRCVRLPNFHDKTVDISEEIEIIHKTVNDGLATLEKFRDRSKLLDKVLKMTGPIQDLDKVLTLVDVLDLAPRCDEMAPQFCQMAVFAKAIPSKQQAIDMVVEQIPQGWKERLLSKLLYVLYLIPVMMLLSLVFYLCFCLDSGVCICSEGCSKGCCAACCYGFWAVLALAVTCGGTIALWQVGHTEITIPLTIGEESTTTTTTTTMMSESPSDDRRLEIITLMTIKGPEVDHLLHDLDDMVPPESRMHYFIHWGVYVLFESLAALAGVQIALLVYMIVVCRSGIYVVEHEFDDETDQSLLFKESYSGMQ